MNRSTFVFHPDAGSSLSEATIPVLAVPKPKLLTARTRIPRCPSLLVDSNSYISSSTFSDAPGWRWQTTALLSGIHLVLVRQENELADGKQPEAIPPRSGYTRYDRCCANANAVEVGACSYQMQRLNQPKKPVTAPDAFLMGFSIVAQRRIRPPPVPTAAIGAARWRTGGDRWP